MELQTLLDEAGTQAQWKRVEKLNVSHRTIKDMGKIQKVKQWFELKTVRKSKKQIINAIL